MMLGTTLPSYNLTITSLRYFSTQSKTNLQEYFTTPRIYNLLRLVTDNRPSVIHRPSLKRASKSHFKLLSDVELDAVKSFANAFTNQRLQMPPVVLPHKTMPVESSVISKDPQLQGILPRNHKVVFTDISDGLNQRNRMVVVRESSGVLRHATAPERNRMNTVYFPLPGQHHRVPLMFSGAYLQDMLERSQYLYILDRACNQFEPDDPEYIHVSHTVYEYVNRHAWLPLQSRDTHAPNPPRKNPLCFLRHTRHYGPLVLYCIAHLGSPGGLIFEAVSSHHYSRVGWLLRLAVLLRPHSAYAKLLDKSELGLPPPNEIDGISALTDNPDLELASSDVENILSYVQLFVDEEPMSMEQKQALNQALTSCREDLATVQGLDVVNTA